MASESGLWKNVSSIRRVALEGLSCKITKSSITLSEDACKFLGARTSIFLNGIRIAFAPGRSGVSSFSIITRPRTKTGQISNRLSNPKLRELPIAGFVSLQKITIEGIGEVLASDVITEIFQDKFKE